MPPFKHGLRDDPSAADVAEQFCLLQSHVVRFIDDYAYPADCFCGRGGRKISNEYDGTAKTGYRNSGVPLEYIVNAVNSHEALVAACEAMIACTGGSQNWNGETHEALLKIEAALLLTKGQQT